MSPLVERLTEFPPPRKPAAPRHREKTGPDAPWQLPPTIEDADVFAAQAVEKGVASEGQQVRFFNLIHVLCETDRMTFWPGGEDGRRATDFAEGKRWVGLQLRRIAKLRPAHRDREEG